MKSTGIVRRIDELGRIVLPIELRRALNIDSRDQIEIYTENDTVIIRKYNPNCTFCGSEKNLVSFNDKPVCKACQKKIAKL